MCTGELGGTTRTREGPEGPLKVKFSAAVDKIRTSPQL